MKHSRCRGDITRATSSALQLFPTANLHCNAFGFVMIEPVDPTTLWLHAAGEEKTRGRRAAESRQHLPSQKHVQEPHGTRRASSPPIHSPPTFQPAVDLHLDDGQLNERVSDSAICGVVAEARMGERWLSKNAFLQSASTLYPCLPLT
jgi:hypothetical protein